MTNRVPPTLSIWMRWVVLLLVACLSGCGSYQRINASAANAQQQYDQAISQVQAARSGNAIIEQSNTPWLSLQPVIAPKTLQPRIPKGQDCSLKFIADQAMSLSDFAQVVSQECRIPVRITQDAWAALANGSIQDNSAQTTPMGKAPFVPGLGQPNLPGSQRIGAGSAARDFAYTTSGNGKIQPIRWLGKPLSGLLDVVTSQLGLYWSYQDGYVTISYLKTRIFHLPLSSELDFETNVSSGASLSGTNSSVAAGGASTSKSTGDSLQKTLMTFKSKFVNEVSQNINTMLTPNIGKASLSPSIGIVTVTDSPEVLDRIAQYMNTVNSQMGRQVMLYVTVAQITLSDSDSLGINWNGVWKTVRGVGFSLANAFTPLNGSSTAGFGILTSASGSASQFAGTQAVLSALATQGSVSIMRQRGVLTQNLQPMPVHVTNETQYPCGLSQTNTAQVGSTQGTVMCSVVTGFALDMFADIHQKALTLIFSLDMSPPATLTQVPGTGTNTIPAYYSASVDRQNFLQRTGLQSGQTMVISDFQQSSERTDRQGIGGISDWVPTGGGTRDKSRSVVVIIISPQIMKSPDVGGSSDPQAANDDNWRLGERKVG